MKKKVCICIFCMFLAVIAGAGSILILKEKKEDEPQTVQEEAPQEETVQSTTEELAASMETEPIYQYVAVEEDGYLVVYERDMETVFLETHIPVCRFSEELREMVRAGKKFEDVEAVYDFLENYSS